MNFKQQREKYLNDPVFHKIVNVLFHLLEQGQFTVGELKDAATFARTTFESGRVTRIPPSHQVDEISEAEAKRFLP